MTLQNKKYANLKEVRTISKIQYNAINIHKDSNPIVIEYSNKNTYQGDTAVTIYDGYKLSIVLTDNCGAVIENKFLSPLRGDIIIFRPNEIHFGRFPKSAEYSFISFYIPFDFFDNLFTENKSILSPFFDVSDKKINLLHPDENDKYELINKAKALLIAMEKNDVENHFDLTAFSLMTNALEICKKCYHQNADQDNGLAPHISKLLEIINRNFPDFPGLETLAENCGCSVTYLTQSFKAYTGKSIYNYVTERRMENARQMLLEGYRVSEACYKSGFSDCSRFISLFKKFYNITPGKFKTHNKTKTDDC